MELGLQSAGTRPKAIEQWFALVMGLVLVVVGLLGFLVTGWEGAVTNTDHKLLGILDINPFHNIVHIGVGALWVVAGLWLIRPSAEGVTLAIGGVLVLTAVLGYLGFLDNLLSIDRPLAPANVLHLVAGLVALLFAGLRGLLFPQRDSG